MKVYYLSPLHYKSPFLFDTFSFESADLENCDAVFFDMHNGFDGYDFAVIYKIIECKKSVVYFDFSDYIGTQDLRVNWFGFDNWRGLENNSQDWARALKLFIEHNLLKVYFMRKMSVRESYPSFVYPIELTFYPDHDFDVVSKEDLMSREFDCAFFGNSSPCRANLICDLLTNNIDVNYLFTLVRLEHDKWIEEHRKAKLFVEADGGGFGSERLHQLMTVSPMLRQRSDQKFAYPFTDMVNCVEIGDGWGRVSREDIQKLLSILEDGDKLYDIYLNGIAHLKKYYSNEARTNYIELILKLSGLCQQSAS